MNIGYLSIVEDRPKIEAPEMPKFILQRDDMKQKVYIVWNDDYKESGISAIFSTREKAEEFVEYSSTDYDYIDEAISEFVIDEKKPDNTLKVYKVKRDLDSEEYVVADINPYREGNNLVTYKSYVRLFNVKARCRSEAIAMARAREQYIKKHREEFPLLGKMCRFRRKLDKFPYLEQKVYLPTYDFEKKEMVTFDDWTFFCEEPL